MIISSMDLIACTNGVAGSKSMGNFIMIGRVKGNIGLPLRDSINLISNDSFKSYFLR